MTNKMKKMKAIIEELEEVESVIKLLKNPFTHITVKLNCKEIPEREGIRIFMRKQYELKKQRLEEELEEDYD